MSDAPEPAYEELTGRVDVYRRLLGPEAFGQMVAALDRPRLPALRVNTLKITEDAARRLWPDRYGWQVQPVPFCPAGWQLSAWDQPPGSTLEHAQGWYYVQDAASMLPAELFSDHPAPLILDLAAAPGGKTTHLASRYDDRGLIVANDVSARRLAGLRANLQSWGVLGALVTNASGEKFGRWFPETFDRVLLDAPCSGDTLRPATGARGRIVSDREREGLCQRQSALLLSAFQAVRPGGEIVYATCTLAPEEDESVLDDLLARFPGGATIDTVERVPIDAPGLDSDGGRAFHPDLRHAFRLWPHLFQTSGFFAARIRKTESIPVEPDEPPYRDWVRGGLMPVSRADVLRIAADLRDAFGFDLDVVLADRALVLWHREQAIYALPDRLPALFGGLPNAAVGFLLGGWMDSAFVPSHEAITRFPGGFMHGGLTLPDDLAAQWLDGRDLRDLSGVDAPPGSLILLRDGLGRALGRGKVQRDRVRNLLPTRLAR